MAFLAGAMVVTSSLHAEDLFHVRELRKLRVFRINGDGYELPGVFTTMSPLTGVVVRFPVNPIFTDALDGIQKSRLVALNREDVDPPFSTIFIAVSRLVCAASAETRV